MAYKVHPMLGKIVWLTPQLPAFEVRDAVVDEFECFDDVAVDLVRGYIPGGGCVRQSWFPDFLVTNLVLVKM